MSSRRRSPSKRDGRAELIHFLLSLTLLAVAAVCFFFFIVRRDFSMLTESEAASGSQSEVVAVMADKAGEKIVPSLPTPTTQDARYAERVSALYEVDNGGYTVNTSLTECKVINQQNGDILLLRGWGYIETLDAARGTLYIAVEPIEGALAETVYFKVTVVPGSTGIAHDEYTGRNLEHADFMAAIRATDLPDGRYALGIQVANEYAGERVRAFMWYDSSSFISVRGGAIDVG